MKSIFILGLKEIKDMFLSRTALLFLILASFIIGNSFVMAVDLYSNASKAAIGDPLYASGFEPTPGVFVPTYGGLFMLFSLFLPFVIIPLISTEKKNNTLSILAQLPFDFKSILGTKVISSILFVFFVLALTIPSFIIWKIYGGHIAYGESFTLLFGYILYGLIIISISLCFSALFENTANAAIFAVATIIASWVIDFAKSANTSNLALLFSRYTFTKMLKPFESGVLSLRAMLYFILLSALFLSLSYTFLRFDLRHRWKWISSIIIMFTLIMPLVAKINVNVDVTESHKNSFAPHIAKALEKVHNLEIDIYLRKTDSRYKDYEQDFLEKLNLIKSDIRIKTMIGDALDNNYGLFIYKVNGKTESTYSNSEEEIFPIIFGLAGINIRKKNGNNFPGYPLVVDAGKLTVVRYVYYLIMPLVFLLILIITSRNLNVRRFRNETT